MDINEEGQHKKTYIRNGIIRKFVGHGKRRVAPFDKVLYTLCLDDIEPEDIFIGNDGKGYVKLLGSERLDINANGITHNLETVRIPKKEKAINALAEMKAAAKKDETILRHGVDSNKVPFAERFKKGD